MMFEGGLPQDPVSWLQRLNERAMPLMPARPPIADSATLSDSVPVEAPDHHRVAAAILAEVGCETVGNFRRMLATAENAQSAMSLAPVLSSTAGGFQSVQEAEEAVTGLAELVKAQGPTEPSYYASFALPGFSAAPPPVPLVLGSALKGFSRASALCIAL